MAPPKGSIPWNHNKGKGRYLSNGYHKTRIYPGEWKAEHLVIATRALGKPLPSKAHVHHYGRRNDNTKLVICEDLAYHKLLHIRGAAYAATGNANARRDTDAVTRKQKQTERNKHAFKVDDK